MYVIVGKITFLNIATNLKFYRISRYIFNAIYKYNIINTEIEDFVSELYYRSPVVFIKRMKSQALTVFYLRGPARGREGKILIVPGEFCSAECRIFRLPPCLLFQRVFFSRPRLLEKFNPKCCR